MTLSIPTVTVRLESEPPLTLVVPPELETVAATQVGLVSTEQARSVSLGDRRVAALVGRRAWRRLTRGVLDTRPGPLSAMPWDVRRRRAAWAALLAFGPDAVAVGACALALHEVVGLPTTITPQAALPRASNRLSRDGLHARQFDAGLETVVVDGRGSPRWSGLSRRRCPSCRVATGSRSSTRSCTSGS